MRDGTRETPDALTVTLDIHQWRAVRYAANYAGSMETNPSVDPGTAFDLGDAFLAVHDAVVRGEAMDAKTGGHNA